MNVTDMLRHNIDISHDVTRMYVDDISDDEMLVRALPDSNHIAWQLGHLIASEHSMLSATGFDVPDLPDGFAEAHGKDKKDSDDASQFLSKAEYLELMGTMHAAAKAAFDRTSEADLDAESPEAFRKFFPTVGSVLHLMGAHEMMHSGQIAAIRRKLGKPIVI